MGTLVWNANSRNGVQILESSRPCDVDFGLCLNDFFKETQKWIFIRLASYPVIFKIRNNEGIVKLEENFYIGFEKK